VRSILRHRDGLVQMASSHVQQLQKALDQMNLQLHHVISDITGVTGLAISRRSWLVSATHRRWRNYGMGGSKPPRARLQNLWLGLPARASIHTRPVAGCVPSLPGVDQWRVTERSSVSRDLRVKNRSTGRSPVEITRGAKNTRWQGWARSPESSLSDLRSGTDPSSRVHTLTAQTLLGEIGLTSRAFANARRLRHGSDSVRITGSAAGKYVGQNTQGQDRRPRHFAWLRNPSIAAILPRTLLSPDTR